MLYHNHDFPLMYTALELARQVLSESRTPMNEEQIWKYAVDKGYDKDSKLSGKTPERTISAQIYVNIRDDPKTQFVKISSKPVRFGLKNIKYEDNPIYETDCAHNINQNTKKCPFTERDLHPLLVSFINSDDRFNAYTKTIHHEISTKSGRNAEKWMHPDLVSVHFPFDDLDSQTIEFAENSGQSVLDFYSFELKIEINLSNVRECFFQAVSNSSWANEGYLVALNITEDAIEQLSRLNASFGIGVIRLNSSDVHQSEILLPSRSSEFVDIGAVNDLLRINKDFDQFVSTVNASIRAKRVITDVFDKIMSDDDLNAYISMKGIYTN